MSRQALVLDANILVRAVLGQRVFKLLNQYYNTTTFLRPKKLSTMLINIFLKSLNHAILAGI